MKLSEQIISAPRGKTHLFYLGQAGFIIKSASGTSMGIDLYLSDSVEGIDGFKRLIPKLLFPEEIAFDFLVTTHWHYDHFDVDSVAGLMAHPQTHLIAAVDCKEAVTRLKIDKKRVTFVRVGDSIQAKDILVDCVFCDHGTSAPDAVGLVITVDRKRIYIAGDTALRLDKAPAIREKGPFDLMIAPINGAFGNMNEREAAELCDFMQPKCMIPCHFGCFAEQGGDPELFLKIMQQDYPQQEVRVMKFGEALGLE